jgi:ubiquinone/menaquinone biosynthesis C-methylase UbiE
MPPPLPASALLAILQPWADVAEPIHRRLAHLADAAAEHEVLWVGCGGGRSVLWWAKRFEAHTVGVDPDQAGIERGERRASASGLSKIATFQAAQPDDLPYEAKTFDVTLLNLLCLPGADGDGVVHEAARVARPMSTVLALVPTWQSTPTPQDIARLGMFGLKPRLQVEWKAVFREASLVELAVEEAAQDGAWIAYGWLGLFLRGWRAAGWAGIRTILSTEFRALRALARRRVLGLAVVKGTRWPHE